MSTNREKLYTFDDERPDVTIHNMAVTMVDDGRAPDLVSAIKRVLSENRALAQRYARFNPPTR